MTRETGVFDECDSCERNLVIDKVRSKSCEKCFNLPSSIHSSSNCDDFKLSRILPTFSQPNKRNPISYFYPTTGNRRGCCVIFSIDTFDPVLCLPKRNGSQLDIQNISKAFANLDFEVSIFVNQTAHILMSTINAPKENHQTCDCFACVILTHGDEGGLIYATDQAIALDHLFFPFRGDQCRDLCGKPKLFFIQACRGSTLDEGTFVCDGPSVNKSDNDQPCLRRIPVEADFLICYAVQPGYFAFRNSISGSWFISALSDCLFRYGHVLDLLSIMTRVNYSVAYEYESNAANPVFSGKKQMPSFVSTLTKQVIFPFKNNRKL